MKNYKITREQIDSGKENLSLSGEKSTIEKIWDRIEVGSDNLFRMYNEKNEIVKAKI